MSTQLNVFLSSKMQELKPERDALYELFKTLNDDNLNLHIWQFEAADGAPATGKPIRQVYLEALEDAALYIGLVWNQYGEWTIDEFDRATEWGVDRQLYVKDVDAGKREPRLTDFLTSNSSVISGIAAKWFKTIDDLLISVKQSVKIWMEERTIRRPGSTSALLINDADDLVERPKSFVGRNDILNEVNGQLDKAETILLQGFGGMGKTALAAEIAAKRISDGKGPVLWLKVGDEPAETLFEALARPFNKQQEIASYTGDAQTQAVRQLLRTSGIRLLVLDDVWNGKSLMQVTKALPRDLPVMITSRQRYPSLKIVDVGRLGREESKQLINTYLEPVVTDTGDVYALCEKLGDNAFALRVAGMTMAVDKLNASQMLQRIAQAPYNLKVPLSFSGEHEESFASLLEVSLNSLYLSGKTGKEAHALFLAFGAFFSPTATPELLSLYLENSVHLSGDAPRPAAMPVEDKLTELQRRGLADRIEATVDTVAYYGIHDLAYSYAHAQVSEGLQQVALNACITLMTRYATPVPENFKILLPELNNFMGAVGYAMQSGKYNEVENITLSLTGANGSQLFAYAGLTRQALILLTQAVTASQKLLLPAHEAVFLSNLANTYADLGRLKESIPYYQQALVIAQQEGDRRKEGLILANLGIAYSDLLQNDMAFQFLQPAFIIAQEFNDERGLSLILTTIGKIYHHEGKYEMAIDYLKAAIDIKQSANDREGAASVTGDLGLVYADLGYYKDAIDCHEIALGFARQTKSKPAECKQLGNLANVYTKQGQFDKAVQFHNDALKIAVEIGDRYVEGINLGGLANAYNGLNRYDDAVEYYTRAMTVNEEVGNRRGVAIQYGNLASVYAKQAHYELALTQYNLALNICREIGDKSTEGSFMGNMGSLYYSNHQFEEALNYYQASADIARDLGNQYNVALMCGNMARVYNQLGMLKEAIDKFEQAHQIYTALGMQEKIAETERYLAGLYKALD